MNQQHDCELCSSDGGEVLFRTARWRLLLVDEVHYPGFCRVVWNDHVREMTDLSLDERQELMSAVWDVETVLREVMQPHKINLASLGNLVPHLHWHIIPRFKNDHHFPNPIWSSSATPAQPNAIAQRQARQAQLPALRAALLAYFQA